MGFILVTLAVRTGKMQALSGSVHAVEIYTDDEKSTDSIRQKWLW